MIHIKHTPPRARRLVPVALATLIATFRAQAQTTTTTGPGLNDPESDLPLDDDVQVLSPFQVESERDFGYVKTNSVTATRIGARIMDTPLQVQVLSEDFIADTNMTDIQDVL